MYAHDNSHPRQGAVSHAVDPQVFHVLNGRAVYVCGLCGHVAVQWHRDSFSAPVWIHA